MKRHNHIYSLLIAIVCVSISMVSCKAKKVKKQRPNILFCIADDASMFSFGAYDSTNFVKTPSVDKLAKGGLVFDNAFNCNPKCAPARACLVTGRYSWQLKAACDHWANFPAEFKFYPQLLMKKGYYVGYTGKGWGPGTYATKYNPAGPEYNEIKLKPPYKGIHNIDYAANFNQFLNKNKKGEPFCFWLGTFEPHRPYEKDSWKKAGKTLDGVKVQPFMPQNDIVKGDLRDYGLEVEWLDAQIGKAVKALKDRGMLDNTLIIFTSDHGMPFPRIKGQLYEEGFHVPFIAYWKGVIKPGLRVSDFINFPDVAPTIMELAGLKPDKQMTGRSFKDVLLANKAGQIDPTRDHALLGKERHDIGRANKDGVNLGYPVRSIRTSRYLYSHNIKPERWPVGNPEYNFPNVDPSPTKDYITHISPKSAEYKYFTMSFGMRPEEELYDIVKDPNCMHNLAMQPEYKSVMQKLRTQMETELKAQGDPRMFGKGDVFDKYQYMGRQFNYKTGKGVAGKFCVDYGNMKGKRFVPKSELDKNNNHKKKK